MTRIQIKGDFGSGQTVSNEVAKAAARKVAKDSEGPQDALLLLDMLGLIDPLPGNEIKIPKKLPRRKPKVRHQSNPGVDPAEYGE